MGHSGFRRDLARFRSKNFAAAKFFRKFRSETRREPHRISRAAARRRSAQCLGTSRGRGQAAARGATADFGAISNANGCGRGNFSKIRSQIRREWHRITHAAWCYGQLTNRGEVLTRVERGSTWGTADFARFRSKNFAAAKNFRKFRSEIRCEPTRISRAAARPSSLQLLGTSKGCGEAAHHDAAGI